jgi:signal transduction histidine kinase
MSKINAIKVLIIDDDEDDYLIIRNLLLEVEDSNYETMWVSNFSDAVSEIKKQKQDVYLIDFKLGAHTGLEILIALKECALVLPMILLTGFSDRQIDLAAMREGASDFLRKNQLSSELLERSIRYSMRRAEDLKNLKLLARIELEKNAAQAANVAKSRFLSSMSHELRTPLTAVLGFTQLAKNPLLPKEERLEFLETISKSGEHLLRVINDILDISKIDDGHLQIDTGQFSVQSAIVEIFSAMESSARAKGITLCLLDSGNVTGPTGVDSHRFRQILFNLVGNGIKFTHTGTVTIELKDELADGNFCVLISDTGIGVSAFDQVNLFRPFSQANPSMSRQYGGTGLGLDLSRKIARALGGDLKLVKSTAGVGSVFSLTLPAQVLLEQDLSPSHSQGLPVNEVSLAGMRILVAEDSSDNQRLLGHFLKGTGSLLTFASNGHEAIAQVEQADYDAILMDIQMPGMDGYEATRHLRGAGFNNAIIALTAHAFNEDRERVLASGFSDFVSKPVDRSLLLAALRRAAMTAKSLLQPNMTSYVSSTAFDRSHGQS